MASLDTIVLTLPTARSAKPVKEGCHSELKRGEHHIRDYQIFLVSRLHVVYFLDFILVFSLVFNASTAMPRCEGLPSGPCPKNVNSRSVKNCQGDMFLCKTCEDTRFPTPSSSTFSKVPNSDKTPVQHPTNSHRKESASSVGDKHLQTGDNVLDAHKLFCDVCSISEQVQFPHENQDVVRVAVSVLKQLGWTCSRCC